MPANPTSCRLGQELRRADDETFVKTSGAATLGLLVRFGRTGLTAASLSNGFLGIALRGSGATVFAFGLTPVKGSGGRRGAKASADSRWPRLFPGFLVLETWLKLELELTVSFARVLVPILGRGRGTGPEMRALAEGLFAVVAFCWLFGFCPRTPLISPFKRLKMPITEFPRSAVC